MTECYCGLALKYNECCGQYLSKLADAPTAEALMRSRYSAFVVKDFDYLVATHDPVTRLEFDLAANKLWANSVLFTKLEVLQANESGSRATVKFRASFTELRTGKAQFHQETSDFRREGPRWYFVR